VYARFKALNKAGAGLPEHGHGKRGRVSRDIEAVKAMIAGYVKSTVADNPVAPEDKPTE
jgi:hypothetical protein